MITDPAIVNFRDAMARDGESFAARMPSFHEFVTKCRNGGLDPAFAVELAAMGESETTAALAIRVERAARAYADSLRDFRRILQRDYVSAMRRREAGA
jgi:hypothetical protein